MTNAQTIINKLLSGYVDMYELSEQAQSVLERIRDRVVSSPDARADVETMYGAQDCDDIALGLMWVCERSANDAEREVPTPEEEQAVHAALTSTLSRMGLIGGEEDGVEAEEESVDGTEMPPTDVEMTSEGSVTEEPDEVDPHVTPVEVEADESDVMMTMAEDPEVQESGVQNEAADGFESAEDDPAPAVDDVPAEDPVSSPSGEATTDPAQIGTLLEQLVEALQAGAEERDHLLVSLRGSFAACLADGSTDDALRRYAEVVDDFLGYVQENELLDDVRVMNFFTNVQEPFSQWVATPEGEREGVLEQGIDFLTDFRAMFE